MVALTAQQAALATPRDLYELSVKLTDEDLAEEFSGFAHDLALILNLPVQQPAQVQA